LNTLHLLTTTILLLFVTYFSLIRTDYSSVHSTLPCSTIFIDATSECASDSTYTIVINSISGGDSIAGSYTVNIDGLNYTYPGDFPLYSQIYSGGDQSVITLFVMDDDDNSCTTSHDIFELNCVDVEDCNCNNYPNSYNINAQANGNADGHTMLYVIVDNQGLILDYNLSGSFPGLVGDGSAFIIYVFNVDNDDLQFFSAELDQLESINSGDPILSDGSVAPFERYCYTSSNAIFGKDCGCDGCIDAVQPPVVQKTHYFCQGDEFYILIEPAEVQGPITPTSIFFSEYLEGSGFNKCLEIYNGTDGAFDLSGYTIQLHNNGNSNPSNTYSFPIGQIILEGDVLVICHSNAEEHLITVADIVTNGPTNFNGDDAVILIDPLGEYVDVIGQLGAAIIIGQDKGLIRKCEIYEGDTSATNNFIPNSEWNTVNIDDASDLGVHSFCAEGLISEECTFELYLNDPLTGAIPIIGGISEGFSSDDLDIQLNYPQDFYITCLNPDSCASEAVKTTIHQLGDRALSCLDNVQVSLGKTCDYKVTPETILSDNIHLPFYEILMFQENGDTLLSDTLRTGHNGEIIKYEITDLCSNNSCWGNLAVEHKIIPQLESPCEYLLGDKQYKSDTIKNRDDFIYSIEIEDDCQDLLIELSSNIKYPCGINKWCIDGLTVLVKKGDDLVEQYLNIIQDTFSFPNIGQGFYTITIVPNDNKHDGYFNIGIIATDCLPEANCTISCGVNRTSSGGFTSSLTTPFGGFISLSDARNILNNSCYLKVDDLRESVEASGSICENGELNVVSYFGKITHHNGEKEEIKLITQSYVEKRLDLSEITGPINVNLPCGFNTHPDSIYHYFFHGDPISDSIAISKSYPFILQRDSSENSIVKRIFNRKDTVESYFLRRIDTIQVERYIDGEWLVVDKVRKELVDTFDIVNVRDSVTQLSPLLLDIKFCDYVASFSDVISPTCGQGVKILRQWSIVDWCNESVSELVNQQIENGDKSPPKVMAVKDTIVSIQPFSCSATFKLPEIKITDDCSSQDDISVSWQSIGGTIQLDQISDLKIEDSPYVIIGTVTDDCRNIDTFSFKIFIEDLIPPVSICQDKISVSITQGELARIYSESFDMGSTDSGCGNIWTKVIRHEDLRGTSHGFWNTKGPNRSSDFGLQPEASFTHTYSCNNEDGDDFKAVYFDANSPTNSNGVEIPKVLGVDIGKQVWFDDYSSFCLEDINNDELYVVLRVFDVDPGTGPVDPRRMISKAAGPTLIADKSQKASFKVSKNEVTNDLYGRYTDCWVKVTVEDKLAPQLICEEITVNCYQDIGPLLDPLNIKNVFGTANIKVLNENNISNGCDMSSVSIEYFIDTNQDGLFTIGEFHCVKKINIEQTQRSLDPYTIEWPQHYDGRAHTGLRLSCELDSLIQEEKNIVFAESLDCNPNLESQFVQAKWCDPSCSLIGYSTVRDSIITSNSCLSIIIEHTVIDWCQWDANMKIIQWSNVNLV